MKRIKGPRLGTKIMLLGLTLLVVPWFSYQQLVEMERLLVQGQSHAQLLTAEGISTLFNGRDDLFSELLPITPEDYEPLYVHPLDTNVRIDGDVNDWSDHSDERTLRFLGEEGSEDGSFELLLGERGGQLHAFLKIVDDHVVYRNLDYLRLDNADHLRVNFLRPNGEDGRISITFSEPGPTTAFRMDEDWKFAADGNPEPSVQGHLVELEDGYGLEFRMPLDLLGSRQYFGLSFVDIDDSENREIRRITRTLPTAGKESFNLVIYRSPELLKVIEGLGYSGARILVIDTQKRVRAETGTPISAGISDQDESSATWISRLISGIRSSFQILSGGETIPVDPEAVADEAISSSLAGAPIALRRQLPGQNEVILAAHPIVSKDSILGTVVVEQNLDQILSFQREALEKILLLSVISLFAVFIALLAFAGRLAWRIRKLRREASAAIDEYGRLRTSELTREINAGDEIGDLARSVSAMLSKLHQHNNFLETMPRTLRHEINNPLNTLSTSLQNLEQDHPEVRNSKYLESAKRGVLRIGTIVQNLADAANLEESLEAEDMEVLDIEQLLKSYVANCSITHKNCEFLFRGTNKPVYAEVADYRIEQMLDKIIDNAVDFHRSKSPIRIQLNAQREHLQITVANRGPVLPKRAGKSLFDSMVSHRGPQNKLHFGLGLYVVRVIVEHHGGFVRAMNLTDGSGVAVLVQLPLVQESTISADPNMRVAASNN